MSKKKAIKITTATAIAASAFVAVAPTQSEAATSSVDKAITKATNQMAKAYDTYHKTAKNEGKLPATGTIRNQVKLAQDYYATATKEIAKNGGSKTKKAAFTKKLDAKKKYLNRAEAYLAAINTNLNPAKTTFKKAVEAGKAKNVVKAKTALVKDVDTFKATVAKIYGPDVRGLLLEKYEAPATELANSVNDELKVYEAYKAIEAGKFADLDATAKYIADVKTEADALKTKTTKLATTLAAVVAKNDAAFEKAKTPVVKEIKVTSDKTVEVKVETARTDLTVKHFTVLVDGKEVTPSEVKSDAKGEVYTLTVAGLEGKDGKVSVNGKETAFEFAAPAVKEVSAINGAQIEIKFNRAVDAETIFDANGDLKTDVVKISSIDSKPTGDLDAVLSADKKTLTVKTANAIAKRYDVTIEGVKTDKGVAVEKFFTTLNLASDTTAPTIVGTEKINASEVKVTFSEPVQAYSNATFKFADGSNAAVTGVVSPGATEVVYTIDSAVVAGKEITGTFIGVQDISGNIISPNPATIKFQKGSKDGVAPTVTSLSPIGTTKLEIKFSEELLVTPIVKVDGETAVLTKDKDDATKYVAEFASKTGLQNVEISATIDLSGQEGVATTKIVNFVTDTVAPKLVNSKVVTDATDKKEYLELAFDEEVSVEGTVGATGTYVKNFITHDVAISGKTLVPTLDKKVVRIALSSLLDGKDVEGGVYKLTLAGSGTGLVKDQAAVANYSSKTTEVSFTRGKDGAPTSTVKAEVETYTVTNNNQVTVAFKNLVDGATATNAANYKIDGVVVEKATLNSDEKTVVLKLQANSNTFSGLRNVSIEGVKAKGSSVAMDKYTDKKTFAENVVPTVTSAKLVDTKTIELKFSETVTSGLGLDFEVLVDSKTSLGSKDVIIANGKATITFDEAVTAEQLAKGISLKATDTIDIKDVKENALYVPANIVVSN